MSSSVNSSVQIYSDINYAGATQVLQPGKYNIGALTIGNDQLSSLTVPSGMKVTLYSSSNFLGSTMICVRDTAFVGASVNDQISSILVEQIVTSYPIIYQGTGYQGWSQELQPGRYPTVGIGNDTVSSVIVPPGFRVKLYKDSSYSGYMIELYEDTPNLGAFNAQTTCMVVERVSTTIYTDSNFGGTSQTLQVGSYNFTDLTIGNDQLSSLTVGKGLKVTLYSDANCSGKAMICVRDTPSVGTGVNDQTSSIKVEQAATRYPIVYQGTGYQGWSQELQPGSYPTVGIGNDTVSSVIVPPGYRVKLYQDTGYSGQMVELRADTPDLGAFNAQTTCMVVEQLSTNTGPVLQLDGIGDPLRLSPLQGLSGQLTMEAWICPSATSTLTTVMMLQVKAVTIALCAGGPRQGLSLWGTRNSFSPIPLCSAPYTVLPGAWTHVAATFAPTNPGSSTSGYTFRLYAQGQLVATQQVDFEGTYIPDLGTMGSLYDLVGSPVIPLCMLSGSFAAAGSGLFVGGISEARFWNTALLPTDIAARCFSRAIGNEAALLACYRLEENVAGYVYDISASRGMGKLGTGCSLAGVANAPLVPTAGPNQIWLAVSGELINETMVVSGTGGATPVQVYDATIVPQTTDGRSLAGKNVRVCVDDPVLEISRQGDVDVSVLWVPGSIHTYALPMSGSLRLRFIASGLGMTTVRVRIDGMPAGIWAMVRPNAKAMSRLQRTTAQDLQTPASGVASPLPAGATAADAAVHAQVMQLLGAAIEPVLPVAASGASENRDFFGVASSIGHEILGGLEQVGSTVVGGLKTAGSVAGSLASALVDDGTVLLSQATTVAKTASQLVASGSGLTDLINAAKQATARWGQDALRSCIAGANSLAVLTSTTAGDVVHVFSIIGTSMINGATVVWRVICTGVKDAIATLSSFFARIGAEITKIINYLAYLLNWPAFLAASDNIYAALSSSFAALPGYASRLGEFKTSLQEYLNIPLPPALANKSISQFLGLPVNPQSPAIKELNLVMEYVQRVMSSAQLAMDGVTQSLTAAAGGVAAFASSSLTSAAGNVMSLCPLTEQTPVSLLTTPVGQLIRGSASGSTDAGTLIDSMFSQMASGFAQASAYGQKVVTGRLYVPGLTPMIEDTILGGRTLNLLRVVSLLGAIPQVLFTKIQSGGASGQAISFAASSTSAADLAFGSMGLMCGEAILSMVEALRMAGGALANDKAMAFLEYARCTMVVVRADLTYQMAAGWAGVSKTAGMAMAVIEFLSASWGFAILTINFADPDATAASMRNTLKVADGGYLLLFLATMGVSIYELATANLDSAADWAAFAMQCMSWVIDGGTTVFDYYLWITGHNVTQEQIAVGLNVAKMLVAIGTAVAEGESNYQQSLGG